MSELVWRPRLRREVVLHDDRVRGDVLVVEPERLARLNGSAAAILALCDGTRSVAAICEDVQARFPDAPQGTLAGSVDRFLEAARRERWIV